MTAYVLLPFRFLLFWFIEAPVGLITYFIHVNTALLHYLSVPLFLRTFFKPLKNEYRAGLVGFSLAMGIAFKLCLLFIAFLVMCIVMLVELLAVAGFIMLPISTVLLLLL